MLHRAGGMWRERAILTVALLVLSQCQSKANSAQRSTCEFSELDEFVLLQRKQPEKVTPDDSLLHAKVLPPLATRFVVQMDDLSHKSEGHTFASQIALIVNEQLTRFEDSLHFLGRQVAAMVPDKSEKPASSVELRLILLVTSMTLYVVCGLIFMPRPTFVVSLALFCKVAMTTAVVPISPLLAAEPFMIGCLFSVRSAVSFVTCPLFLHIIDGRELMLLQLGLALLMCCGIGFALTFDYWTWFALRALLGVSISIISAPGQAFLSRFSTDRDDRARSLQISMAGLYLGVAAGPVLGGAGFEIDPCFPWVALVFFAGLALFLSFFIQELSREKQDLVSGTADLTGESLGVSQLLFHPKATVLFASIFLANAYIMALEGTGSVYMMHWLGWSVSATTLTWGACCSVGLILTLCLNTVSAQVLRSVGTLRISLVLACLGSFSFLGSGPACLAVILAAECSTAIVDTVVPVKLADLSEEAFNGTSKIFTISSAATELGFVLGPFFGGLVFEVFSFALMCQAFAASALIILVFTFFVYHECSDH